MATVLVIGASRGIGLEFVRQYRAAGDTVIATARDAAGLARLRELGAQALALDVNDEASQADFLAQLSGFGSQAFDIALYVAGVFPLPDARTPPQRADFDHAMHTNVLAAMQLLPRLAPLVGAAPRGRFAFLSSEMAQIEGVGDSQAWVYRASKAALNMAVASAQNDYPQAILVALSPGWVQTDMGGAEAPLTVQQSVAGMRSTLERLEPRDRGAFFNYDGQRFSGW